MTAMYHQSTEFIPGRPLEATDMCGVVGESIYVEKVRTWIKQCDVLNDILLDEMAVLARSQLVWIDSSEVKPDLDKVELIQIATEKSAAAAAAAISGSAGSAIEEAPAIKGPAVLAPAPAIDAPAID